MNWRVVWCGIGVLLLSSTVQAAKLDVPLEAQRYLHDCINAVTSAQMVQRDGLNVLGPLSCESPLLNMRQFDKTGSRKPAVARSQVKFGPDGIYDFQIAVTDIQGNVWTGSLGNYPKVRARPVSAEELARRQKQFQAGAAQNVLRRCEQALAQYHYDHSETMNPAWGGKSCRDAGLSPFPEDGKYINKSLIVLHPESWEGYRVTVWPTEGEPLISPVTLTPRPPPPTPQPTLPQPLGLILGCLLTLLVGGVTLLLTTFKLPSSRIVGGLGMGLGAFHLATALLFPQDCCPTNNDSWIPAIVSELGQLARLLLTGAALLVLPRLVRWWGREVWWVSMGSGVMVGTFVPVGMLGSLSIQGLSDGLQVTFRYGLPILAAALTLWAIWQRAQLPPNLP